MFEFGYLVESEVRIVDGKEKRYQKKTPINYVLAPAANNNGDSSNSGSQNGGAAGGDNTGGSTGGDNGGNSGSGDNSGGGDDSGMDQN